jgi:hypothetical protein
MGLKQKIMKLAIVLPLGCLTLPVIAHDGVLEAQPAKCVSLKQGNVCYAKVTLHWHTAKTGDYCLYQLEQEQPLQCWQQVTQGKHRFEFAFPATQHYQLRGADQQEVIAQTRVEVKWVYKSRRDRRFNWRVF